MKKLLILLAASAALLLSCRNSDPVRDALLERTENLSAPGSVTYDAPNSTSTSLAVYWDASVPLENGAISFLVQASTDEYFYGGDGGALVEMTVDTSSSPNDAVIITGLADGEAYFLRVASVYPGPSQSEWAYLTDNSGKTAAVIPGKGFSN